MRWRTAILVLIPAVAILGWLAFNLRSPTPQAKTSATTAEQSAKGPAGLTEGDRRKYIHEAAHKIVELEEMEPDMGGTHLKNRYAELLRAEEPLRLEYEAIKAERVRAKSAK